MNFPDNTEHKTVTNTNEEKPGFDRRMTWEEINKYPIKRYNGAVCVVSSPEDLIPAAQELNRETVLGFDTETRPSFKKGLNYSPALIQLASRETVYLFHLTHLTFPPMLREILSNPGIIKAGVAVDHDITKLKELGHFRPAGFVDLGDIARNSGIKNHGLRGLAAILLGVRISKQAQVSNWAQKALSPEQVRYAATDAWASREIYLQFKKDGFSKSLTRTP